MSHAPETYFSTDIESDGPIPGPNSMLSLASAAYAETGKLISTFSVNIQPLEGASGDPDTMLWWSKHPEAWRAVQENQKGPAEAMSAYCAWVREQPHRPVFVGYPTAYDFTFVYWYCVRFTGSNPFSSGAPGALDIKTMAMAMLGTRFRETSKRTMPRRWFSKTQRHTHVALDDALEQGELFCNMLRDLRRGRPRAS